MSGRFTSGSGGWGSSGNPDTASGGDTASLNNPGNWYEFGSGSRNPIHNMTGPMDAYGNGGEWTKNPIWQNRGLMELDGAGAGQSKQPVSSSASLSARWSAAGPKQVPALRRGADAVSNGRCIFRPTRAA
jgi:hypothetical protein